MHPARKNIDELLAECDQRTDRRSGPGGQHRNKVETAVIIVHRPTGIVAEANERRSQVDNRRNALFRLRLALATEHRQPADATTTQPSALWQSRAAGRRLNVSAAHDDFPALLAELLDHLQAVDYELSAASGNLGVSSSQLLKLLRSHPPAFAAINQVREQKGLRKLS